MLNRGSRHLASFSDTESVLVFIKVNWNRSDTRCIEIMDPFKPYENFRKMFANTKIKNAILKTNFYERVCSKLWHPANVLGEKARDTFISEFALI